MQRPGNRSHHRVHSPALSSRQSSMSVIARFLLCTCLLGICLSATVEASKGLNWMTDWEQAVQVAKKQDKLIVLDLYTNWCTWCRVMDVETFGDRSVIEALGPEYVWLRLNAETEEDGRQAQRRFRVTAYPATLVIEPEDGLFEKTSGFLTAEQLPQVLEEHRLSLRQILELRARVEEHPESTEAMLELAAKYMGRRHYPGAERLYRALIEEGSGAELDQSYFSLAISLAQQDKEQQALEQLDALRNRFPESDLVGHTMALQGEIQLNLGNRSKAARIWREYLIRFPNHALTERVTGQLKQIESS